MDRATTAPDALTERVSAIIAGMKQIPVEMIGLDTPFRELGMDSLDGINMIYEIEIAYDVSISNEEAAEIGSVRELVAKVQTLLSER